MVLRWFALPPCSTHAKSLKDNEVFQLPIDELPMTGNFFNLHRKCYHERPYLIPHLRPAGSIAGITEVNNVQGSTLRLFRQLVRNAANLGAFGHEFQDPQGPT